MIPFIASTQPSHKTPKCLLICITLFIAPSQVLFINSPKKYTKKQMNDKKYSQVRALSSLSSSILTSLRNIFLLHSSLLSLLVNFVYLSLIQIHMSSSILTARTFISNNHQNISFSMQSRLSRNFSSNIKAILSLTLQVPIAQLYFFL